MHNGDTEQKHHKRAFHGKKMKLSALTAALMLAAAACGNGAPDPADASFRSRQNVCKIWIIVELLIALLFTHH